MKKLFALVLAAVMCCVCLAASASSVDLSTMTEDELRAIRDQIDTELSARTAAKALEGGVLLEGDIDNYHIALMSVRKDVDYKGDPVAVLTIMFTNNDEDGKMYMMSVSTKVFQNGVQLERAISIKGVDAQQQMLEVKNGASIELSIGYLLDGSGAPIDIEIGKYIDFSGNGPKLVGTFQLTD